MHKFLRPRTLIDTSLFLAAAVLTSCGGTQAGSADSAPVDGASAEQQQEASEQPKAFHDMKKGERLRFMEKVVMPRMTELFREADPTRYAEMNCKTCHGSGARQGHFRMPDPDLPRLDVTDSFAAHRADSPEITQFMMERVVPEMAQLLGEAPYDPETNRGFGCFDCHEKK